MKNDLRLRPNAARPSAGGRGKALSLRAAWAFFRVQILQARTPVCASRTQLLIPYEEIVLIFAIFVQI